MAEPMSDYRLAEIEAGAELGVCLERTLTERAELYREILELVAEVKRLRAKGREVPNGR